MIVYFLRHASAGKAKADPAQDDQRPLDEPGIEQSMTMGRLLARLEPQVEEIISSPLQRARQTADSLARKLGLRVEVRPELREMHFGRWEGLSWNQIVRRYPRLASRWIARFPHQAIPGAEPLRQFRKRIAAGVNEIVAENRGQCALVVTHAGVIRFTLGKVLGLPARNLFRLSQDPCAVNVIDFLEGGAVVRCING